MRFRDFAQDNRGRDADAIRGSEGEGFLLLPGTPAGQAPGTTDTIRVTGQIEAMRASLEGAYIYPLRPPGVTSDVISMGRSPENDVQLDLGGISKRHIAFHYDNDTTRFAVMDLGSLNGTQVNGEDLMVGVSRALRGGDIINLGGQVQMTFHTFKTIRHACRLVAR